MWLSYYSEVSIALSITVKEICEFSTYTVKPKCNTYAPLWIVGIWAKDVKIQLYLENLTYLS